MEDSALNINRETIISVSRNRPLALVVGVGGFLGSFIAEEFIEKGVQILGIDDLEVGTKENLEKLIKSSNFHFIHKSLSDPSFEQLLNYLINSLPRLDYAVFAPETNHFQQTYSKGVINFLELVRKIKEKINEQNDEVLQKLHSSDKPKIAFISSIELYHNNLDTKYHNLKEGEIRFAKFVKHYKLNGRVIRLAALFGPRMSFRSDDPLIRLIQSSLTDNLPSESVSLDFSTRSLFVSDAAFLVVKSLLSGSTANKIYDGAPLSPIKVSEIKQILLDPLWHEARNFKPTELPPWPTPNLERTAHELSWKPKTEIVKALRETIAYFKEHDNLPQFEELKGESKLKFQDELWRENLKRWSFSNPDIQPETEIQEPKGDKLEEKPPKKSNAKFKNLKNRSLSIIITGIIVFGLFVPAAQLLIGSLSIRANLRNSSAAIIKGDFKKANQEIQAAKTTLNDTEQLLSALVLIKRIGLFEENIERLEEATAIIEEGVSGVEHAILGTESLFKTTKLISGEQSGDPKELYLKAQSELSNAVFKIDKLKGRLKDKEFTKAFPSFLDSRIADLAVKVDHYSELVSKARSASYILPEITAVEGKKSYLVLLQNNLELRPGGGFIGSYAKFDFEEGRISNIKVDDIYALDGGLSEVIEPPEDLKNDLGQNRLYLRDSNFEPDFPTSARTAQIFYRKEAGENVNGVIAMDLSASGNLLNAVSGLDLPDYGEHVSGNNLFERAITHAEVSFFPGSQAKKNYLTSLQQQLFNKVFYLSNQNWPAIISALAKSLEEKHLLVYLSDTDLFSYLASENWSGVVPRGAESIAGESKDFLATVESNMGANKSNYYLKRSYKLETAIGKEGQINHKLVVDYKNTSPSEVFPAGKYKNRFKIYLPNGAKLTKAVLNETEVTSHFKEFSAYGRTGYSSLVEIEPKEKKKLILEYILATPLQVKEKIAKYRLDIVKQAGTEQDAFEWELTYPLNLEIKQDNTKALTSRQELNIKTDLRVDRSFEVEFSQR